MHTCVDFFFFFNDTATTEIYTLSLHDALPISEKADSRRTRPAQHRPLHWARGTHPPIDGPRRRHGRVSSRPRHHSPKTVRSEEHTSELQSRQYLVCRLLLEKKKHKLHTRYSIE